MTPCHRRASRGTRYLGFYGDLDHPSGDDGGGRDGGALAAVASSCRCRHRRSGHAVLSRADRRDRAGPGARRADAEEAEAARIEAGRRLLRAVPAATVSPAVGEPALRRRRAASTLALSMIPILALAAYGAFGSPHLPGHRRRAAKPAAIVDMAAGSRRSRRIWRRIRRTDAAGRSSLRSMSAPGGPMMPPKPTRPPCGSSARMRPA